MPADKRVMITPQQYIEAFLKQAADGIQALLTKPSPARNTGAVYEPNHEDCRFDRSDPLRPVANLDSRALQLMAIMASNLPIEEIPAWHVPAHSVARPMRMANEPSAIYPYSFDQKFGLNAVCRVKTSSLPSSSFNRTISDGLSNNPVSRGEVPFVEGGWKVFRSYAKEQKGLGQAIDAVGAQTWDGKTTWVFREAIMAGDGVLSLGQLFRRSELSDYVAAAVKFMGAGQDHQEIAKALFNDGGGLDGAVYQLLALAPLKDAKGADYPVAKLVKDYEFMQAQRPTQGDFVKVLAVGRRFHEALVELAALRKDVDEKKIGTDKESQKKFGERVQAIREKFVMVAKSALALDFQPEDLKKMTDDQKKLMPPQIRASALNEGQMEMRDVMVSYAARGIQILDGLKPPPAARRRGGGGGGGGGTGEMDDPTK